uniref:Uncharacterized protein LOC105644854 isoform X2 n=1 Tax=Rhizophora mucronata TaxID=61149 RepID=A0A2P2ME45_RHIMU
MGIFLALHFSISMNEGSDTSVSPYDETRRKRVSFLLDVMMSFPWFVRFPPSPKLKEFLPLAVVSETSSNSPSWDDEA